MKSIKHTSRNFTMLAIVGLMSLLPLVQAQEKGATKLMQLRPIATVADAEAVEAGDTVVMSCPKCKNSWVTVVTPSTKTGPSRKSPALSAMNAPAANTRSYPQVMVK